jgi:periplasmic protein TonB
MAIFPDNNALFDDLIFDGRNKEYGAYLLRKNYKRNISISLLISISIVSAVIISFYFDTLSLYNGKKREERIVDIKFENIDQPEEAIVVPPPPPVSKGFYQQSKYVPPVVIDSVETEEPQLMTADEATEQGNTSGTIEPLKEVHEEVQNTITNEEPFLSVEEMPVAIGGAQALREYIAENTRYPVVASENNIQGKVFVKFCVTATGNVDQVSIFKGVDPLLDAEALRVVRSFPRFEPGKQSGRAVPVWLIINIDFKLN